MSTEDKKIDEVALDNNGREDEGSEKLDNSGSDESDLQVHQVNDGESEALSQSMRSSDQIVHINDDSSMAGPGTTNTSMADVSMAGVSMAGDDFRGN